MRALFLAAAAGLLGAAVPPPSKVDVGPRRQLETAVLAGGCFWGIEGVFEHVKGVRAVTSGYAGGRADEARYETVGTERTRHAEAVRIVYDPRQVSYATLLRIFFASHDPTQVGGQGPDRGPSYRSAIFPQNAGQKRVAAAYVAQLNASKALGGRLTTQVEGGGFYPAETYHQDFLRRNPDHPYIRRWDMPKLTALKANFPNYWRA